MKAKQIAAAVALAGTLGLGIGEVQAQQTYTLALFPELPVVNGQVSLALDPRLAEPALNGATVVAGRLYVTFTTLGDFDAADLVIQLTTPIESPSFGTFLVNGGQLGWFGPGTFSAEVAFADLNGTIPDGGRAPWFFDLFHGSADPASFSGQFSLDSRIEIDFVPPAGPCPADFNADGSLDPDDLGDFINCYFSDACAASDFNADGAVDPDDLGDFINAYFAGCP